MQGNLFEAIAEPITEKNISTGLIISKQQKQILSKQQQTFNRLVKKIEKLRLDLDQLGNILDQKLDYYQRNVYPLEQEIIALDKRGVKLLFGFFSDKKLLPAKERKTLGKIISRRLDEIFQSERAEPDDELKEIFRAVEGISFEEAADEDFNELKSHLEMAFEEFGFDLDLDDFHRKMSDEETIRKMKEMEESFQQQLNDRQEMDEELPPRKKTKKQLEREEREKQIEEAKTKNIAGIYKQLAKILHPDLEQDEQLKLEKEELMKQLTIAYENNDLHTLLNLELSWIRKEENTPDKLSDEKLGIYNEVLKEQVDELEEKINEVSQHQRYQPLHKFSMFSYQLKAIDFSHIKRQTQLKKDNLKRHVSGLEGKLKSSVDAVKKMIRDFEMQRTEIDLSSFFR